MLKAARETRIREEEEYEEAVAEAALAHAEGATKGLSVSLSFNRPI